MARQTPGGAAKLGSGRTSDAEAETTEYRGDGTASNGRAHYEA